MGGEAGAVCAGAWAAGGAIVSGSEGGVLVSGRLPGTCAGSADGESSPARATEVSNAIRSGNRFTRRPPSIERASPPWVRIRGPTAPTLARTSHCRGYAASRPRLFHIASPDLHRGVPAPLALGLNADERLHNLRWSGPGQGRSEEHTSELQSLRHLVCRLL